MDAVRRFDRRRRHAAAERERRGAKIVAAQANPVDYFELTFSAAAGKPYRLWIRAKATRELLGQRLGARPVQRLASTRRRRVYRIGTPSEPS